MQSFYKFLKKFFQSLWWDHLFWMSPLPNRNVGGAVAVQDLRRIHVWNFFWFLTPEAKSWRRPCIQYILYTGLCPPPQFIRGGPHVLDLYKKLFTGVTQRLSYFFTYVLLLIEYGAVLYYTILCTRLSL